MNSQGMQDKAERMAGFLLNALSFAIMVLV